ncbi:MAG: hypothetical protein ACKO15_04740, partial [Burkholderiales bacterium]
SLNALFIPFEFLWWSIAGLVYLLVPAYRRYKQDEWRNQSSDDVAVEIFVWVVCAVISIVLVGLVIFYSHR